MIDERKSGGAASFTIEDGLVGDSPPMRALADRIERVARSALPVLVRGETGSGKELVARAIHRRSRRTGAFVSENCAALADSLLEAELFGHEQGAFTGADRARDGLFARAHGGTLFIDEVGDMSPAMQAKLLRVLQDGEVRRLGGQRTRTFDVRVIAATHKDLEALVRQGLFREDLLFRLAVLEVRVPALRDRPEDLPGLVEHFLRRQAAETGQPPLLLSDQTLDALMAHAWPGNVRELENAVRVAALFSQGGVLDPAALPFRRAAPSQAAPDQELSYQELRDLLEERERAYVREVLATSHGNKAEAARRLGVTRYALYRTLRRLGIDAGDDAAVELEPALAR
ncbi:MAG: sigma-54-dependent Fis family transcriptional regulator [Planctomycetes bacterium]|nr:sigma-54-dependent Fis family transcriptional regulator [Planctomycetota bacterium]